MCKSHHNLADLVWYICLNWEKFLKFVKKGNVLVLETTKLGSSNEGNNFNTLYLCSDGKAKNEYKGEYCGIIGTCGGHIMVPLISKEIDVLKD